MACRSTLTEHIELVWSAHQHVACVSLVRPSAAAGVGVYPWHESLRAVAHLAGERQPPASLCQSTLDWRSPSPVRYSSRQERLWGKALVGPWHLVVLVENVTGSSSQWLCVMLLPLVPGENDDLVWCCNTTVQLERFACRSRGSWLPAPDTTTSTLSDREDVRSPEPQDGHSRLSAPRQCLPAAAASALSRRMPLGALIHGAQVHVVQ